MATFRHRLQRNIRDFVTLVTMIYDLFDIDMPFELVGVSRSTELVLRFNSAGHMWESEMLPVECIMVREVEHVLDVPASSNQHPSS